ncbi:hypothetical protein NC797_11430 [Aquibacillus sp. 3ASR75-11]|uniref:Beta-ketoacyl synthase-like N-terminal domain-containing protein n=1 Tax=Terrihalobacillus insolitus TaxID=2950438 RepID=A0A9X3WV34_9BACI|nr:beta-ketoacyl synthase N-terminal-like domain-containing protein [Terrihalobacillus insolitus]MDC3425118.1 hypothetical protein [Terrihalobacillus insolitus]
MDKIAVTGVGAVTPTGDQVNLIIEKIRNGQFLDQIEIEQFNLKDYINKKGLRTIGRSAKIAIASTAIALEGHENSQEWNMERVGVFVGTSLSYLDEVYDFLDDAANSGAKYVSPMRFPNTVLNNISGWVSIVFNIQGVNNTLQTGITSPFDAIDMAKTYLENDIIDHALVIGVDGVGKGSSYNKKMLGDGQFPEHAATIILERENEAISNYGYIDFISSWQEFEHNSNISNKRLNTIFEKYALSDVNHIIFGSSNENDAFIRSYFEDRASINQYKLHSYTDDTMFLPGMLKVLLALEQKSNSMIVETNQIGNKSILILSSEGVV